MVIPISFPPNATPVLSPLSVPIPSERDGFSVSIQMAGSSESLSTAAVTTTGRKVSVVDDAVTDASVVEVALDWGESPV